MTTEPGGDDMAPTVLDPPGATAAVAVVAELDELAESEEQPESVSAAMAEEATTVRSDARAG